MRTHAASRPDPNLAQAPPQQKAPFGAFCYGGDGGIRTHDLGLFLRIQICIGLMLID